eukprot:6190656-Pleurochrysis_carterae.AAC.1
MPSSVSRVSPIAVSTLEMPFLQEGSNAADAASCTSVNDTEIGELYSPVLPSCPSKLLPHAKSLPSAVKTAACLSPHAILMIACPRNASTGRGTLQSKLLPCPSTSPSPHVSTAPFAVNTSVKPAPQATLRSLSEASARQTRGRISDSSPPWPRAPALPSPQLTSSVCSAPTPAIFARAVRQPAELTELPARSSELPSERDLGRARSSLNKQFRLATAIPNFHICLSFCTQYESGLQTPDDHREMLLW